MATETGVLGIAAKVKTDWGITNDPAHVGKDHVICVYTLDYRDQDDVARVARSLADVDAIRRQTIHYKPDVLTFEGYFKGSAPGEVAIYSCAPPYHHLAVEEAGMGSLREALKTRRSGRR